ncbi:RHS repeat-associated core domain-containing protein [Capnocytophaga canimorsus]|uniref:RHS repeat-associated core domain-containing protein n=1 Tax=Capnocytophaga canimorsus TaxID=28188 RepID=UPI00385980F1
MDYDRQGLEIQRTLSGGVVAQTKRDRLGRVRFQNAVVNELTTHLWREYDWNYDHRLASITDHKNHHTTAFEYDDRGFLERAIYNRKEQVWRTADKLGNLYQSQEKNDRQYQSSQLQYDGKWYYYYDKEGNLILKSPFEGGYRGMSSQPRWSLGSWAYEWNANGSLKKVKRSDGSVITFKYDAFGRRIEKKTARATTHFVWDGNVPLHEWKTFDYRETTDNDRITWIFQDFVPVAKLQGDKSYSIISDHIGTPLVAIDNEGVKVWERELDIYGKVRKETKETPNFVPFRYQGQYYDSEVDLCYNRFRYYDCNTGSYISQDPIRLAGGNPTIYGYVEDPNVWIDVFGLNEINDLGQIGEINAGITKNTKKIPSDSGKKKFRIPDQMSLDERHITEVKNVNYQYFSSQLQDDLKHVNREGIQGKVTLIVDERTILSKKLKEEINKGNIELERKNLNKRNTCT